MVENKYQSFILRWDTIHAWNIVIHQLWRSYSAICFDICELIYCHFNAKTLLFRFLWLEFRFKSFLQLQVHFKGFMCIRMRKLHKECTVPADAHDRCQIVFSFNVSKFVSKYLTTKQLSQMFEWSVRTLAQYMSLTFLECKKKTLPQRLVDNGRNSHQITATNFLSCTIIIFFQTP